MSAHGFDAAQPMPLFDAELGQIFLRMRTLLGLSLWDMARAVGGEPTVIANLEAGATSVLPPWPELTRLVEAYARLTGVDTQPIMARLLRAQPVPVPTHDPRASAVTVTTVPRTETGRGMPQRASYPMAEVSRPVSGAAARYATEPPAARRGPVPGRSYVNAPALAVPAEVIEPGVSMSSRMSRWARSAMRGVQRVLRRRLVMVVGLLIVPALLLVIARLFPLVLYSAISPMPEVIERPLRGGVDRLVTLLAPVRDGLSWVDVGDPRMRKSDRLPEHSR